MSDAESKPVATKKVKKAGRLDAISMFNVSLNEAIVVKIVMDCMSKANHGSLNDMEHDMCKLFY